MISALVSTYQHPPPPTPPLTSTSSPASSTASSTTSPNLRLPHRGPRIDLPPPRILTCGSPCRRRRPRYNTRYLQPIGRRPAPPGTSGPELLHLHDTQEKAAGNSCVVRAVQDDLLDDACSCGIPILFHPLPGDDGSVQVRCVLTASTACFFFVVPLS